MNKGNMKVHGAVIVTRVSTGEQVKSSTSPETQLELCRAKAQALNIPIVAEYFDGGVSGGLLQARSGMMAAIADIQEGRADTMICPNIDRYSRNVDHQRQIKRDVKAAGGRIVFCNVEFEDSPEGDMMFTFLGSYAEYERATIRKRSIDGKMKVLEKGQQPIRGMRPFGYRIVNSVDVLRGEQPADMVGKYLIVEEEARWAREMFARYAAGASLYQIGHWLQDSGVSCIRGGKAWHANTVTGMIRNPVYKGWATYGKRQRKVDETRLEKGYKRPDFSSHLPEDQWHYIPAPALVDEVVWNTCQERLRDNQRQQSGRNPHLLTGLILCPQCGRNMRVTGIRRKYTYYRCRDHAPRARIGGTLCNAEHYNGRDMEELAVEALRLLASQPEAIAEAVKEFQSTHQSESCTLERSQIETTLAELDAEEAATVKAQIRGVASGANVALYDAVFSEIAEKRSRLKKRLAEIPSIPAQTLDPETLAQEARMMAEQLPEVLVSPDVPLADKRALLMTIIEALVPEGRHGLAVSLRAPMLYESQTVRRIVIRRSGNSRPVLRIALRTRSRDSCTAASGSPTIVNEGIDDEISTSTRTT